jgi:hypothetical protein
MKPSIDDTRRQLGELGAMAQQTEAMERRILERAQQQLAEVEKQLPELRSGALAGESDASMQYQQLIEERGRLHQVIAQANRLLAAH